MDSISQDAHLLPSQALDSAIRRDPASPLVSSALLPFSLEVPDQMDDEETSISTMRHTVIPHCHRKSLPSQASRTSQDLPCQVGFSDSQLSQEWGTSQTSTQESSQSSQSSSSQATIRSQSSTPYFTLQQSYPPNPYRGSTPRVSSSDLRNQFSLAANPKTAAVTTLRGLDVKMQMLYDDHKTSFNKAHEAMTVSLRELKQMVASYDNPCTSELTAIVARIEKAASSLGQGNRSIADKCDDILNQMSQLSASLAHIHDSTRRITLLEESGPRWSSELHTSFAALLDESFARTTVHLQELLENQSRALEEAINSRPITALPAAINAEPANTSRGNEALIVTSDTSAPLRNSNSDYQCELQEEQVDVWVDVGVTENEPVLLLAHDIIGTDVDDELFQEAEDPYLIGIQDETDLDISDLLLYSPLKPATVAVRKRKRASGKANRARWNVNSARKSTHSMQTRAQFVANFM